MGRYDHINFVPPKSVSDAAAAALDVRAKKPPSERGMTPVGLARARDLKARAKLSPETVRRMLAYLDRHQGDKKGSTWKERGKGWQAWMGWGGDAGWAWARKVVAQMEAADRKVVKLDAAGLMPVEKRIWASPAGKSSLADRLVPLLHPHETYTECFAGAGSVFFVKEASKVEVLNDKADHIAQMYRDVQALTDDEIVALGKYDWVGDKTKFYKIRDRYRAAKKRGFENTSRVDRVYWYLYLNRHSYAKVMRGFDPARQGASPRNVTETLKRYKPRLEGVQIFNEDYSDVLKRFDSESAMHFLDPPYFGTDAEVGDSRVVGDERFTEEKFAETVAALKGKVLITYGSRGRLGVMMKDAGFKIFKIRARRTIAAGRGGSNVLVTQVMTNYDLSSLAKGLDDEFEIVPVTDADFAAIEKANAVIAAGFPLTADPIVIAPRFVYVNKAGAVCVGDHRVSAESLGVPAISPAALEEHTPYYDLALVPSSGMGEQVGVEVADGMLDLSPGDAGEGVVRVLSKTGLPWLAPIDYELLKGVVEVDWEKKVQDARRGFPGSLEEVISKLEKLTLGPAETAAVRALAPTPCRSVLMLRKDEPAAEAGWQGGVMDVQNPHCVPLLSDVAVETHMVTDVRRASGAQGAELLVQGDLDSMALGESGSPYSVIAKGGESYQAVDEHFQWVVVGKSGDEVELAVTGPVVCGTVFVVKCDGGGYTVRYEPTAKAEWSTAYVNDLPDSAFLYVEPGGDKDGDGKTVPRRLRHFPYKNADGEVDLPHLRNAIARIPQAKVEGLSPADKEALQRKARRLLEDYTEATTDVEKWLDIYKVDEEERTATGPVLIPDVVDAQGDIVSADVIRKAAHDYLMRMNVGSGTKWMHREKRKGIHVVESWLAPIDLDLGGREVSKGTWVLTMKYLDDDAWREVKTRKMRGYSIGGSGRAEDAT